jgi:hypothetical protein
MPYHPTLLIHYYAPKVFTIISYYPRNKPKNPTVIQKHVCLSQQELNVVFIVSRNIDLKVRINLIVAVLIDDVRVDPEALLGGRVGEPDRIRVGVVSRVISEVINIDVSELPG